MRKYIYSAIRSVAKFDRKVVKRYLNIETPLYKLWWSVYKEQMQSKLNADKALKNLQY